MLRFGYDPAYTKLVQVKAEAESLDVPESIISGLQNVQELIEARANYCESQTSEQSAALNAVIKETLDHPWEKVYNEGKTKWKVNSRMMSGSLEGYVLKFLVSSTKAKRVLEVGLFTGCAALGMAEALPEDGKVVTCEIEPYLAEISRRLVDESPHGKKVEILQGPALETMNDLAKKGETFDFVFIDADKDGYIDYCRVCLDHLLAPGGTIAVDNTLWSGRTYVKDPQQDDPVVRFNKWVLTRKDIYQVLMPIRDGIMLIRRKEDMNG